MFVRDWERFRRLPKRQWALAALWVVVVDATFLIRNIRNETALWFLPIWFLNSLLLSRNMLACFAREREEAEHDRIVQGLEVDLPKIAARRRGLNFVTKFEKGAIPFWGVFEFGEIGALGRTIGGRAMAFRRIPSHAKRPAYQVVEAPEELYESLTATLGAAGVFRNVVVPAKSVSPDAIAARKWLETIFSDSAVGWLVIVEKDVHSAIVASFRLNRAEASVLPRLVEEGYFEAARPRSEKGSAKRSGAPAIDRRSQ